MRVALGIVGVAVAGLPLQFVWQTVASLELPTHSPGLTYGFRIEKPLILRDEFRVTLFGPKFSVRLQSVGLEYDGVLDQQWYCEERVLYLTIPLRRDLGSYALEESKVVIFDFERGELYTSDGWNVPSPSHWRSRSPTHGTRLDPAPHQERMRSHAGNCGAAGGNDLTETTEPLNPPRLRYYEFAVTRPRAA